MLLFIVTSIFVLDRLTKYFAIKYLILHESIPVVNNFFHFTLVHNYGSAFGILKNQLAFLILVTLFSIFLIFYFLKNSSRKQQVFLAFILAGAVGNLFDRVFMGYVIDFLDFRVWPVFNLADSSITIGSILLGISLLRESKNSPASK